MSFIAQPIIALNNRIRGIITLLNSEKHDDLKGTSRKPQFKSQHGGSLASGSHGGGGAGGKAGSAADDSIFKSEEELEAFSTIHELQHKLEQSKLELQHYEQTNDGLRRENGAMRVDMNRAVIELEELVKQLSELKAKVSELQTQNKELAQEKGQLLDLIEDEDEEGEGGLLGPTSLEEEASMIGANLVDALSRYKNPDHDSPFRTSAHDSGFGQAAGEQSATAFTSANNSSSSSSNINSTSVQASNPFGGAIKTKANDMYPSESEAESGRDEGYSSGGGGGRGLLGLGRRRQRRQTGQSSDEKGPESSDPDDDSIGNNNNKRLPIIGGMFQRSNQLADECGSLSISHVANPSAIIEEEDDVQRRGLFKGRFRRGGAANNNTSNPADNGGTDEEGDDAPSRQQQQRRRPRRGVFGRGRRGNEESSPDLSQAENGQLS